MTRTIITRTINAPLDLVFTTVADIRNYSKAIPHLTKVEFLSETTSGIGTRFRETRLMRGKAASTELEVTEYAENEHIRLVADSHGTIWDSLFEVVSEGGATTLTLTMDARAYKLLPKVINALMKGMIAKEVAKDMDFVKSHCEGLAGEGLAGEGLAVKP